MSKMRTAFDGPIPVTTQENIDTVHDTILEDRPI